MLHLLDELLRKILLDGVTGLQADPPPPPPKPPVIEDQVGFRAPDNEWADDVVDLQLNALNVYLVDLRENRKLRSNERERRFDNGLAYDDPAPARLDCHYLITAWSPTKELTPQVEPVLDEHELLYQATAVLLKNAPLNPSRVYPLNSGPLNDWPARFREVDLPTAVAPVEGFPKLAEFWGTMGANQRWKPALYLVVTVPVELLREIAGPMVTTRITEYRHSGRPETAEVWIQIGGTVFDKDGHTVAGAWVRLETISDEPLQTTETDAKGRFTFNNLRVGRYQLRTRTAAGEKVRQNVDVPSDSGEYDLKFP